MSFKYWGKKESLWVATTSGTNYPFTNNQSIYDVVIIGAGLTGLMSAYYLRAAGLKVAIFDAVSIVKGTTGYTTAKITSAHGLIYNFLIQKFGLDTAKTYSISNQWAIEEAEKIVKRHKIDCGFERQHAYNYATSSKEAEKIELELKAAKKIGLPVQLADLNKFPFKVVGAMETLHQAQFHPREFLLKIAEVLADVDVKIFEQTRVSNISENGLCKIETSRGPVRARYVIIATNNQFMDAVTFSEIIFPYRSYLTAFKTEKPLIFGMFYSNDKGAYSIRNHNLGKQSYLLLGGEGHIASNFDSEKGRFEKLVLSAQKIFGVKWPEFYWTAQDNISIDRLPLIGKLSPRSENIFFATGYSAWGMTKGFIAAKLLSDLVLGKNNDWLTVYNPWSKKRTEYRKKLYQGNIDSVDDGHYIQDFLSKKTQVVNDKLANDSGEIVKENGEPIAYYKNSKGEVTKLSPICKHMGCIVAWNGKDKTWDCPCHGSRYDKFGKVIKGPAQNDLDKIE